MWQKVKAYLRTKVRNREKAKINLLPEQVSNTLSGSKISFKTIYVWIYKGYLNVELNNLRRKGKSLKSRETRGKFNIGKSIKQRPKIVKNRSTFGHWNLIQWYQAQEKAKVV